jgi:hypothetical protein
MISNELHHTNRAHCGSIILSMSKQIMNIPIELAKINNIPLYYTDTDSIRIPRSAIPSLIETYKKKHNKDLIGDNLGQFGFDMKLNSCNNIYANQFIAIGKKCYTEHLIGTTPSGAVETGYTIKMKGVPIQAILDRISTPPEKVRKKYVNKKIFKNPIEMYESIYAGDTVDVDCLSGGKVSFEFSTQGVSSRPKLTRSIRTTLDAQ